MPENLSHAVYEALTLLKMYDIDKPYIRIGNDRDGAYILVAPDEPIDIISFGISDNVTFEREMAQKGHRSFMFDHTIDKLPEENPFFSWKRSGICGDPGGLENCSTMDEHLGAIDGLTDRLILKMDIEGHEWGVFWKMKAETFQRFDQILVELHWLTSLNQPGFIHNFSQALANINEYFTPYHVHANNCAPMAIVEGFPVADVLEISYIRTDLVKRSPSRTVFPTVMNKGNRSDLLDYPLLFYPFLPTSAKQGDIDEMVQRIVDEKDTLVNVV